MNGIRISTTLKGTFVQNVEKQFNISINELKKELRSLAQPTLKVMLSRIETKRKGKKITHPLSPGNSPMSLVDSIKITYFPGGWGIGHKPTMNQLSPHWALMNWGGRTKGHPIRAISARALSFTARDGKSVVTQQVEHPGGKYRPMNYIEKGRNFLSSMLDALMSKSKTSTKSGDVIGKSTNVSAWGTSVRFSTMPK